jgi:uncharacterized protein
MLDASAFLGEWPFRSLAATDPGSLRQLLVAEGFTGACVSPLSGLFHADPEPANARWAERLRDDAFFRFVPVLNPTLPGAVAVLTTLREREGAVAVRLYPNYHCYRPTDPCCRELARAAGELELPVVVQLRMQDLRSMHSLAQVPDTDWREGAALARACPGTYVLIAGAKWGEAHSLREEGRDLPRLYLETSHLEYVDPLRRFLDTWGADRLLIGSHAPLFTPAAARLKVTLARLGPTEREALVQGGATQLGLTQWEPPASAQRV